MCQYTTQYNPTRLACFLGPWGLLAAPRLRQPDIQARPAAWRCIGAPPGFGDPRCAAGMRGRTGLCSGPPWVIRRASFGVAVQPRCDAAPDRNHRSHRAPGPGRRRARAALRASASNGPGPREGPSVYCTGALRKALARGSKGVHVPQRRCPGVCEGTAGRGAHPRLAQVVHQLTQGGVCWRRTGGARPGWWGAV